jgi:hypothetical protein
MATASERTMKWRRAHKDIVRATDRAWRYRKCVEWKLAVLSHYGPQGKCQCSWPGCEVVDPDMLVLDHIQNDGAADRRGQGVTRMKGGWGTYYKLVRMGFPAGFQTLCHNHNWKKEIMRRREARIS